MTDSSEIKAKTPSNVKEPNESIFILILIFTLIFIMFYIYPFFSVIATGILPEALKTKCARCSPQQLESGLKIITKLYYDYPTQYSRLRAKWDPTGEYHRRFEEYLRGLQFNTINNDPVPRKTSCLSF